MRFPDSMGADVTAENRESVEAYNRALSLLFTDRPGVEAELNNAVAADPGFALARVLLARIKAIQKHHAEAKAHLSQARLYNLTERERSHFDCFAEFSGGIPSEAAVKMQSHLRRFPGDMLILGFLTNFIFFHGGENKKQRIDDLFLASQNELKNYRPFWSRYSFHMQEMGRFDEALVLAEESLAADAGDLFALHTLAHVHHQQHRPEQVIHSLRGADLAEYSGTFLAGHLAWHRSLCHLLAGDAARSELNYFALERRPGLGLAHLEIADFTGLQWRHIVSGCAFHVPPDHMKAMASLVRGEVEASGMAFSRVHCALFAAATGDTGTLKKLRSRASGGVETKIVSALAAYAANQTLEFAAGLQSFSEQDLEPLGGSNVERKLFVEIQGWAARRTQRAS